MAAAGGAGAALQLARGCPWGLWGTCCLPIRGWGCSGVSTALAAICSAVEILVSRQRKAEALKKMTDVAVRMSEEQLVELRADIKVSFLLCSCLI